MLDPALVPRREGRQWQGQTAPPGGGSLYSLLQTECGGVVHKEKRGKY